MISCSDIAVSLHIHRRRELSMQYIICAMLHLISAGRVISNAIRQSANGSKVIAWILAE